MTSDILGLFSFSLISKLVDMISDSRHFMSDAPKHLRQILSGICCTFIRLSFIGRVALNVLTQSNAQKDTEDQAATSRAEKQPTNIQVPEAAVPLMASWGSESESISMDLHAKTPNFTAVINMTGGCHHRQVSTTTKRLIRWRKHGVTTDSQRIVVAVVISVCFQFMKVNCNILVA